MRDSFKMINVTFDDFFMTDMRSDNIENCCRRLMNESSEFRKATTVVKCVDRFKACLQDGLAAAP